MNQDKNIIRAVSQGGNVREFRLLELNIVQKFISLNSHEI